MDAIHLKDWKMGHRFRCSYYCKGHKPGQQLAYNFLNCADTKIPGILKCNDSIINLNEGKIDGNPVLNLVVEARGGMLIGSKVTSRIN